MRGSEGKGEERGDEDALGPAYCGGSTRGEYAGGLSVFARTTRCEALRASLGVPLKKLLWLVGDRHVNA